MWQCAACKTRSFLRRDTCRGCGKQRDVKQDEHINEWSQTVAWPQQGGGSLWGGSSPCQQAENAAQALALARQQLAQAKASALPEACIRILENEVQQEEVAMKEAQPLGQKMDQASCYRIWRVGDASAAEGPREFRASTAGGDARPDRPGDAHAGSPRCQQCQFHKSNVSLVKIFGSFDRNHRKSVEPGRWTDGHYRKHVDADADHLIQAIQESRAILQTSSVIVSQEGGAALDAEQDPELWNLDGDESDARSGHAKPRQSAHR